MSLRPWAASASFIILCAHGQPPHPSSSSAPMGSLRILHHPLRPWAASASFIILCASNLATLPSPTDTSLHRRQLIGSTVGYYRVHYGHPHSRPSHLHTQPPAATQPRDSRSPSAALKQSQSGPEKDSSCFVRISNPNRGHPLTLTPEGMVPLDACISQRRHRRRLEMKSSYSCAEGHFFVGLCQ